MSKVAFKFNIPFSFAENGYHVKSYDPGIYEVSERCAQVAKENGVGDYVRKGLAAAPENKNLDQAPQNKDNKGPVKPKFDRKLKGYILVDADGNRVDERTFTKEQIAEMKL